MTTESARAGEQLKPAILIGYGSFGRKVLRRLLRKSAPRGALIWDLSPHSETGIGKHRLRDLALLHMPDAESGGSLDTEGSADFILDLYRQIHDVPREPGSSDKLFCDAVAGAAANLVDVRVKQSRKGGRGLDVVVIAHVAEPAAIGTLELHTGSALERLVSEVPDWRVTQQSERKLNALWILDFDNFRHPSMLATRQALRQCLGNWKQRLDTKRPSLDRAYLVDGRVAGVHRRERDRVDEITAFLELLLFSGLRDDVSLRSLYEQVQVGPGSQIAAAFGIRVLEAGSGLLGRIAAARYGETWLAYLRGDPRTAFARTPHRIEAALAPIRDMIATSPAGYALRDDPLDELDALWDASTARLRDALATLLNSKCQDWIDRAEDDYDKHCRELELALGRLSLDLVRRNRERLLGGDGTVLAEAVSADLHDSIEPVPLRSVIDTLSAAAEAVEKDVEALTVRAPALPRLEATAAANREYLAARERWLAGSGRKLWLFWPLVAAALGLALTPFVLDLLRWLPTLAAPGSAWSEILAYLRPVSHHPGWIAAGLGVAFWLLLATSAQRRIAHTIDRAQAFYLDPERGRLADAIRSDVSRLEDMLAGARANVRSALAADLLRHLGQIRERLTQREREIEWLRRQLREFQRMLGLHDQGLAPDLSGDSCHLLVQADGEWGAMSGARGADSEACRGHQEALPEPFRGWDARFCDAFLDLFAFVEALSGRYRVQLNGDALHTLTDGKKGADGGAPTDFLVEPALELSFAIDPDKSTSEAESYCVLPEPWHQNAGLGELLRRIAITRPNLRVGADPARIYLIRHQINIPPAALESTE